MRQSRYNSAVQMSRFGCFAFGWLLAVCVPAPSAAQSAPASNTLSPVGDSGDKTGTNPANLENVVEVSNRFDAVDEQLFFDQVTWRYGQAFDGRRMRARVELPLSFANVTGRTEAGFGDVGIGWEWLSAVRGRVALLAGVKVTFDSSTNEALGTGHHTAAPSLGVVFVPRGDTVLSVRYDQRLGLGDAAGRADINDGLLEVAIVRRFAEGTWLRALSTLDVDFEQRDVSGRLEGEWGHVLAGGLSTWVRAGGGLGKSSPFDWTLHVGFRLVP